MKKYILLLFVLHSFLIPSAQEVVQLAFEKPTNTQWNGNEKQYFSTDWETEVVTNVSVPTIEIYKADEKVNTGASVVIAPGGGLYALSIQSEGIQVAQWLAKKGITAFVLKYRLVPSGEDGVKEMGEIWQKNVNDVYTEVNKVIPYSIEDGLQAIAYARSNAKALSIDPHKIGFMGFSAGGAVTMGVAYNYTKENRPDFLVPVYAWTDAMPVQTPKKDAPPLIVICASDDPLGLAKGSIDIYNSWNDSGLNAALHMYSKGGHGFGMRVQKLPSDQWIQRFYDWSVAEGFTSTTE